MYSASKVIYQILFGRKISYTLQKECEPPSEASVKASATSERGMSMKQDAFGTLSVAEEQCTALQETLTKQVSPAAMSRVVPCNVLSVSQLAAQCLKEIENYHRGEPNSDAYGVELLRRATMQGDQEAWAAIQHCYSGL